MYDKRLVINYLIGERNKIDNLKFYPRELEVKLIKNKAISIIGPRRAGKSTFLKIVGKKLFKNPFYIDFENIVFRDIKPEELFEIIALHSEIFGEKPDVLLLDEIQNLPNWSRLVRSLLDEGYVVFLSGSSSKLLSSEVATELRGRTISYTLLPFSFKEYLSLKGIEIRKYLTLEESAIIRRLLREYLLESSYPEIVLTEEKFTKEKILAEYLNTIFYKDFVERYKLKSLDVAKFIFNFFLQNYSCLFSVNKIVNFLSSKNLKFGKETVYEYVEKLPESFVVFLVENFNKNVYKRESWPKKIYVCDLGLSNLLSFSEDMGRRMENTVFLELKRKENIFPLMEIFFLKSSYEVDFVVKDGLQIKQLIQVTYAYNKDEIDRKEIDALIKASQQLKCKDLLIITWDYEDEVKVENKVVKFLPLWKWLVNLQEL